jgi:hypothetical protein
MVAADTIAATIATVPNKLTLHRARRMRQIRGCGQNGPHQKRNTTLARRLYF